MLRNKFKHTRVYHCSQQGTKSINDLLLQFTSGSLTPQECRNQAIDLPPELGPVMMEQDLSDLARLRAQNRAKYNKLNEERNKLKKEHDEDIQRKLVEYESMKKAKASVSESKEE